MYDRLGQRRDQNAAELELFLYIYEETNPVLLCGVEQQQAADDARSS